MKSRKLAIHGGSPIRTEPFEPYNTIGKEEIKYANTVLDSGLLSGYIAVSISWGRMDKIGIKFCEKFGTKFAISVNSATSGFHAAVAAAGEEEGDEVIVSPYSMSASATSIVMTGAKPIFVDVESDCFCLNADQVEQAISKH